MAIVHMDKCVSAQDRTDWKEILKGAFGMSDDDFMEVDEVETVKRTVIHRPPPANPGDPPNPPRAKPGNTKVISDWPEADANTVFLLIYKV